LGGEEAERWGFYNSLAEPDDLLERARELAHTLANGPTFAHAVTKKALHQEWNMGVDEAIEAEAEAQAICMQTEDFVRAYRGFLAREKPRFEGN
jgi:enoyl-CoA hydratase/carnithine racemase